MTGTVKEGTTSRSRRRGTFTGLVVVALLVAVMLAITSFVTGVPTLLWVALALVGFAAILAILARRAATHRPPGKEPK
jgi:heme A synthase